MEPILDSEQRDLEEALMRAGRDVHMSPQLRDKTLAALAVGTLVTATTTAKAGWLGWFSSKGGALWAAGLGAIGVAGGTVALNAGLLGEPTENGSGSAGTKTSAPPTSASPVLPSSASSDSAPASPPATTKERPADGESSAPPIAQEAGPGTSPTAVEGNAGTNRRAKKRSQSSSAENPSQQQPSGLRKELSHIARAEAALAAGHPAQALSRLAEYRDLFTRPQLGLEAEVLTIQALYESGSVAAAQRRAARFIEAHPKSPLGTRARQYLE